MSETQRALSRRKFLRVGTAGVVGAAGVGILGNTLTGHFPVQAQDATSTPEPTGMGGMDMGGMDMPTHVPGQNTMLPDGQMSMPMPGTNRDVDHAANGFDPSDILTDFDGGKVSVLPSGQTLREYTIESGENNIEIVPGLMFAAWTFDGRIPGPTIRAREGDKIRIHFRNAASHPHGMHFHGIHPGNMDGAYEQIPPGGEFTYEFDAEPFGLHLYHCHASPLAKHISKGLFGAFIIEPKDGWPKVDHEYIMVMSGYDVDFDSANDFYVINGIPFHYDRHPIKFKVGETVRIFLVNILEYDPINSFHLHANFFHYYPTGTSLTPSEFTDTIGQMQGQRGILEFSYKFPGRYMFHAHKTEFAELGWTGVFEVTEA